MARQCFYCFHYKPDVIRVSQVRNIGAIEGNRPATDNTWETVTRSGDEAIKRWIATQMKYRSCTIVLVGSQTANRKWINYEISKSWNEGMGVVGIRIHGIKNFFGQTDPPGGNPFDYVTFTGSGQKLSTIVKCYNPAGADSREKYGWIAKHLVNAVDEAIRIRKEN